MSRRVIGAIVLAAALAAACTVHETGIPSLTGPSGAVGVIVPISQTPTARFTSAPSTGLANAPITFDGSTSCVGQADPNSTAICPTNGGVITAYTWSFGDGASANGPAVSHAFGSAGTYSVRLTVTNDGGLSGSTSHSVTVGVGSLPTPAFTISPTNPAVSQTVTANGSTSTPGVGHVITSFAWEWGDNTPMSSGQVATHVYTSAATFVIVLTVGDEAGQYASRTATVTVGSGAPTAVLVVNKTGAPPSLSIQADGSASTATGSATIAGYRFVWGDGSPDTLTIPPVSSASHIFGGAGSYTVRLIVTDSVGRTGTTTQTVTVP